MPHALAHPSRSHAPAIRARDARRPRRSTLAAVAIGGLGVLAAAALPDPAKHSHGAFDRRVRGALRWRWWDRVPPIARLVGGRHARRFDVNEALGGLGGKWPTIAASALAAAIVGRRYDARRAIPVAAAAPLAIGAHLVVKVTIGRRRPLGARLTGKTTPGFPSGHAARVAALTGIVSHVVIRERLVSPAVALPVAVVVSMAGGMSRVLIDRHWTTDLVGGWGLGVATAAVCALWYDAQLPDVRRARIRAHFEDTHRNAPCVRHRSGMAAPDGASGVYSGRRGAPGVTTPPAQADDEGDVS